MDVETLACHLMELLAQRKPEALTARFKIVPEAGQSGWDLLEAGGRKRGFLISGGEVDLERMANILLDEFRGASWGGSPWSCPRTWKGRPAMTPRSDLWQLERELFSQGYATLCGVDEAGAGLWPAGCTLRR